MIRYREQMDALFDEPSSATWLDTMRAVTKPTMNTFISLGLDDLTDYPHSCVFKQETPTRLTDQIYDYLSVYNYVHDPVYPPEGKIAMTIPLGVVYSAGQRLMPTGGLPVAAVSGRTAVQHLCRDTNTVFVRERGK